MKGTGMLLARRQERASTAPRASAVIMGDTDLLRPLGLSGVRAAVVAPPSSPAHQSRFAAGRIPWSGAWEESEALVEELLRFAEENFDEAVPLFYQYDRHLLLVSRHRDRLAARYRFVLPRADLVEDLVDKVRFEALARRMGLPVPATTVLTPDDEPPEPGRLTFPVLLKPGVHLGDAWLLVEPEAKAVLIHSWEELASLWPKLRGLGVPVLAQEVVPGPESRIESYHSYVDAAGVLVADFTGRKIRTRPVRFGYTTALSITDAEDVRVLGRQVVVALDLRGVAKLDFKRTPEGSLRLLEVNPRFNLWHHPAAVAGVNLPAMVWADLTGGPRPLSFRAQPGVRWSNPWQDRAAARETGVGGLQWALWTLRCESRHVISRDDLRPLVHGIAVRGRRAAVGRAFKCLGRPEPKALGTTTLGPS